MELPKQLASWHEILGLFPEDIAQFIINVAKQLSPLIETVSREEHSGAIEPDGFGGLTAKANYERLLLTEWGLQDYFPEEFIRRAVSGEHLFFDLQKIEHRDDRHCYVLFDCGPKQLGRPRLVQLVVLMLLARRASKTGVKLSWGILQDSQHTIYESVSKESINQWLEHRTARDVSRSQLTDWLSTINLALEQQSGTIDDLWMITPKPIVSDKVDYMQVKIVEPLLDLESIDVSIESKRKKNALSLKLSDEPINVRVIRDPFGESKKIGSWERADHVGRWIIGVSGMRLACFNSAGALVIYKINKHKTTRPGLQQIVKPKTKRNLAGAFVAKNKCLTVSYDDQYLYIDDIDNKDRSRIVDKPKQMIFSDGELAKIALTRDNPTAYLFIMDASNTVSFIDILNPNASLKIYKTNVVTLGQSQTCPWLIENEEESISRLEWYLGDASVSEQFGVDSVHLGQSVFSHGSGIWHKTSTGPIAFQVSEDHWRIIDGSIYQRKTTEIMVSSYRKVIGVINVRKDVIPGVNVDTNSTKSILIVIERDGRTVSGISDDGEYELAVLENEYQNGEINPQHLILHYVDKSGDFLAVNLITGRIVFQLQQGHTV